MNAAMTEPTGRAGSEHRRAIRLIDRLDRGRGVGFRVEWTVEQISSREKASIHKGENRRRAEYMERILRATTRAGLTAARQNGQGITLYCLTKAGVAAL